MNLGRELGEIINSQQDRILSLAQENTKLKRETANNPQNLRIRGIEKDMTWKI